MFQVTRFIATVLLLALICFQSCNSVDSHSKSGITDTLYVSIPAKDSSESFIKYVLIHYQKIDTVTQRVEREFINSVKKFNHVYSYLLIKRSDSLCFMKTTDASESSKDSVYIDLRSEQPSKVYYFLHRLNSNLKFVRKESCIGEGKDSLLVMYGNDIGLSGNLYWYFDQNMHLKRVVHPTGKVLMSTQVIDCSAHDKFMK